MTVLFGALSILLIGCGSIFLCSGMIFQNVNSQILQFWLPIMNFITACAAFFNIFWTTFWDRAKFGKLLNSYHSLDQELLESGAFPINYGLLRTMIIFWLIFVNGLLLIFTVAAVFIPNIFEI